MALVELANVTKTYHDHVDVHALRGVSLSLEMGEFAAAAGPSGSGKTTLLNVIGGLDLPDDGRIEVAGLEMTAAAPATLADFRLHHIGFVFQSYNLLPVLSVVENIEFVTALQGVPKSKRLKRSLELLEIVGLLDIRDKRPNELSGGQQQRVAVLRAIAAEPEIVLADEPTANLDSTNAELLLDMMAELNKQKGTTFLFSTHDPLVMQRARRLIRMKDGSIVGDDAQAAADVPEQRD